MRPFKQIFLMGLMLFLVGTGVSSASTATSLLMPKPHQLTETGASFDLNRTVTLTDPTGSSLLASLFTTGSGSATVTVSIVSSTTLGTFDYTLAGFDNEGYKLSVTNNDITITAATKTGVIRAAQTLMQLSAATGGASIPGVEITDYPAFKLRGYMHDVGRSFISFAELKKEIDLLSRFKVNVFHWHLTDNQGFRFESKEYPQLNQASNMTRFAGSYYTQAQCTELEAYAAERGVIVIPEIDMPGHSTAFTNAMGFTMSSDEGKAALKVLLGELANAFPLAPYIHMGADEAGTTAAFVNEMSQYIKETLGRKCIVWNPISGVTINTTNLPYIDMTEMWSTSGKLVSGLPNIDCRYNYVNHFDVFADLVGIYKSNVYYAQQGSAEVAGAITALWNDRKTPTETDIISQNNLYANALATAERGWMGGGSQYIEKGGVVLPNNGSEFEEFADWERRFLHYKGTWLAGEPIPYVKQTNVKWRITDPFPNGGTASAVFPPEQATDEILPDEFTYDGKTYTTGMATGAGIYLRHVWGTQVPAFVSAPALNTTAYAWTYVYSPTAQTAGALIEFHNYSRSENDKAPDAGNWDRKGSRIWVNGEEVAPPTWTNSGRNINSEVDLANENFPARSPLSISLKAGWNKVFLKLPYVAASNVRLNKWMFTFVLTDATGRNALDGLVYSPIQSMDENIDGVLALIGEVKQYVNNVCGTAIGYYPQSTASALMAKVEEIEGSLQTTLTAAQRATQETELQQLFDSFKSGLGSQTVNQPLTSAGSTTHYYTLCTPLRGTRYVTASGTASELGGATSVSTLSYWKFVDRGDGTMDIVNGINDSYIAPNGTNNSALSTQVSRPSAGWVVGKANTPGYVIITSGTCQFNQTNNSSSALSGGYRVFNWGSGTNITDTGCQYLIEEVSVSLDGSDVEDGGDTTDGTKAVNVGSQVTSESGLTSGKVYVLMTGASRYITDNGTNYDVPNAANTATEASAYYLISNGDGTWTIKNYATGKCWGVPVYNAALTSADEASAGAWSLNFSGGVAYPSCPDAGGTVRGIDRSSGKVWGWTTGTNNNHKVYIYEVEYSTTAGFDAFQNMNINVGSTPAATLVTGRWYVMSQRSRGSYVFEDVSTHTLKHTLTKPSGLATATAQYLVRLLSGSDGKYYFQNGLGNYFGRITQSTNVPTTALGEELFTVAKIAHVDEHYYVQCGSTSVVLDGNDFTLGDPSTVVGWGTTIPTSTGGNNDWAFYPVELEEAWVPTASEVYTINNTNSNRGALVYDGSSENVNLVASANLSNSNANHQWVFYPTGTEGQYYLFNVGAGKFAIPTAMAQSNQNVWKFSDNAVAVTLLSQSNGTYRIKAATDPVSGTNAAVIGVNININPKVFNYEDTGSDFTITQVSGADASAAVTAAVGRLVKNQSPLTSFPSATGWYAIQIKSKSGAASYAGRYLYPSTTLYNGLYPLTFTGNVDVQPAITDPTYFMHIDHTSWDSNRWQMSDGRYLTDNGSNKFPTPSATAGNVVCGYSNGNYFKTDNNYYADPYNSGASYFIGETTSMRTAYTVYPIDLASAGLAAWQMVCDGAPESQAITCLRSDVAGPASVYRGGWIFLPTGVTPSASDFSMDGSVSATVDASAQSVTFQYDPNLALVEGNVTVEQGWQTVGRDGEVMLLRVTAKPFKAATGVTMNIALKDGAENNIASLTLYEADSNSPEIYSTGTGAPAKTTIATTTVSATSATLQIGNLSAGTHYYWIGATAKSDAALGSVIDAAVAGITYTCNDNVTTLDLTAVGDPADRGAMVFNSHSYPFLPRDNGSRVYRIPAMVVANDGSIVVAADKRYDSHTDIGNGHVIDIVVRRSTDGGKTWSEPLTIAKGLGTTANGGDDDKCGYGDPSLVKGKDGKLYCLFVAGNLGYFYGQKHIGMSVSEDNGVTWSSNTEVAPVDLYATGAIQNVSTVGDAGYGLYDYFVTSGRGLYTSDGILMYLIPAQTMTSATEHTGNSQDYIFYSTDNGQTWYFSPTPMFTGGDEAKIIQTGDGTLLGSVRQSYNRGFNTATYTKNQDGTLSFQWGTQWNNPQLNAGGYANNQDIFYYQRQSATGKTDVIFHSMTTGQHANLKLYYSTDQGANWTEYLNVQTKGTRYVTLEKSGTEENPGSLYLFFEDQSLNAAGGYTDYNHYPLNFVEITREQLESLIPSLNDEPAYTKDVKIVYGGTGEAVYGSWNGLTWTSNAASGQAGLTLSLSAGSHDKFSNLNSRYNLAYRASSANTDETFTLTAPAGYVITGYSFEAYTYAAGSHTITAEDGTTITTNNSGYQTMTQTGLNAASTAITVRATDATRWLALANFVVSLTPCTNITLAQAADGLSYATLFLPNGYQLTEDVKAYKIIVAGDAAHPVELGQGVPASTPVMLCSETGVTSAQAIHGSVASVDVTGNLLVGNSVRQHVDGYVLNIKSGVPGFYKLSDTGSLAANRAYLPSSVVASGVKTLVLQWQPVGIEGVNPGASGSQTAIYDLSGRKVQNPGKNGFPHGQNGLKKGVYILDGRKVLVK